MYVYIYICGCWWSAFRTRKGRGMRRWPRCVTVCVCVRANPRAKVRG